MLFVDDRQAQVLKDDLLLKEGVCAHHHPRLADGDARQAFLALPALVPPGEPGGLQAQGPQPGGQVAPMLLGKKLGGGHEGHLTARLHRLQGGEGRHHRLPRPHISLEQAQHGT